jgi:hypothetical protein
MPPIRSLRAALAAAIAAFVAMSGACMARGQEFIAPPSFQEHAMNRFLLGSSGHLGAVTCATLLSFGCGGGGELTEPEAEARAEALKAPITIGSFGANVVSRWHEVTGLTTAVPASPAGVTPEERRGGPDMSTVQLAVYDAVVAIAGGHKPYAVTPTAPTAGASMDAAANEAAYRVLLGLFPSRSALYQGLYDTVLAEIPAGDAKARGMAVGAEVAQAMLALRANDGRSVVLADFVPGTQAGDFRNLNPINQQAYAIKPFSLTSLTQFRPPGPPAIDSAQYAIDFDEVKALGGAVSALRTPLQTEAARFHTAPPPRIMPTNLQQFATSHASLADNARVMAALWTAIGDAGNACFEAKYHYHFWRPQSAIQLAADDGNAATLADAAWTAAVPTPNHPEYPSAHGCVTGSTTEVLRQFYGTKKIRFSYTSSVTGTTRAYETTTDFVQEVMDARVWGGMHFRTSNEHGAELGKNVGRWVMEHHFQPVD